MPAGVTVRITRIPQLLDEWRLVLRAADIAHRAGRSGADLFLVVDAAAADSALDLLAGYDEERRRRRPAISAAPTGSDNAAWLCASAILLIHLGLHVTATAAGAIARGANRTTDIYSGELWRPLTALTLHADALHAFSNAAATILFLSPLCHLLGGGTAVAVTLLAGTAGNLINAVVRGGGYSGIGASTAVFAALGILAGLRLAQPVHTHLPMWRRMRPLAAALALLAMLGAAPHTDVGAHLLGLASGAGVGLALSTAGVEPPSAARDRAASAATAIAIAAAWTFALLAA